MRAEKEGGESLCSTSARDLRVDYLGSPQLCTWPEQMHNAQRPLKHPKYLLFGVTKKFQHQIHKYEIPKYWKLTVFISKSVSPLYLKGSVPPHRATGNIQRYNTDVAFNTKPSPGEHPPGKVAMVTVLVGLAVTWWWSQAIQRWLAGNYTNPEGAAAGPGMRFQGSFSPGYQRLEPTKNSPRECRQFAQRCKWRSRVNDNWPGWDSKSVSWSSGKTSLPQTKDGVHVNQWGSPGQGPSRSFYSVKLGVKVEEVGERLLFHPHLPSPSRKIIFRGLRSGFGSRPSHRLVQLQFQRFHWAKSRFKLWCLGLLRGWKSGLSHVCEIKKTQPT